MSPGRQTARDAWFFEELQRIAGKPDKRPGLKPAAKEVVRLSVQATRTERRDWDWDLDGTLDGRYVETRSVVVRSGPSAGMEKVVIDFHIGLDDELVSVWETKVLKSKFARELRERRTSDFESGERITITPLGMRNGPNGPYRDFDVTFEFAAPKRTAADLLSDSGEDGPPLAAASTGPDDDIPFG